MPYSETTIASFKIVRWAAVASGALVLAMVSVTIASGIGFLDFESLMTHRTVGHYNAMIVDALPVLQLVYPVDTLYIFSYAIMVIAMAHTAPIRSFAWLAIVVVLLTGFLDFVENNLIMANANAALLGYPASALQVQIGSVITQTKFNLGLLLTLTISFLIPFDTPASAVTRWMARVLVVVAPVALLDPTTTLIYIVMNIFLFGLIASVYANASDTIRAASRSMTLSDQDDEGRTP